MNFNLTQEQLLIQKCGGPRGEVPFEIVEWGVKYEPVATSFYENCLFSHGTHTFKKSWLSNKNTLYEISANVSIGTNGRKL